MIELERPTGEGTEYRNVRFFCGQGGLLEMLLTPNGWDLVLDTWTRLKEESLIEPECPLIMQRHQPASETGGLFVSCVDLRDVKMMFCDGGKFPEEGE